MTDQSLVSTFVVVSGPPASGKTALARALAPALDLPLVAKDTIKHALMTVMPVSDIETSRVIGRASVAALLAVAAETNGAVLESVWHRSDALPEASTDNPINVEELAEQVRAAVNMRQRRYRCLPQQCP